MVVTAPAYWAKVSSAAFVTIAADGTKSSIPFQYNPDSIRRTLQPNTVGGQPGERSEVVRFVGAPTDSITLDCRLAADERNPGDANSGVAPRLAALSLLAYPSTTEVMGVQSQLDSGSVEVSGILAKRLLLVFGEKRVIPCRLSALSIVEQLYDNSLTPILAVVTASLHTLSYSDVAASTPTWQDFINYQTQLEQLAPQASQTAGT